MSYKFLKWSIIEIIWSPPESPLGGGVEVTLLFFRMTRRGWPPTNSVRFTNHNHDARTVKVWRGQWKCAADGGSVTPTGSVRVGMNRKGIGVIKKFKTNNNLVVLFRIYSDTKHHQHHQYQHYHKKLVRSCNIRGIRCNRDLTETHIHSRCSLQ